MRITVAERQVIFLAQDTVNAEICILVVNRHNVRGNMGYLRREIMFCFGVREKSLKKRRDVLPLLQQTNGRSSLQGLTKQNIFQAILRKTCINISAMHQQLCKLQFGAKDLRLDHEQLSLHVVNIPRQGDAELDLRSR
jgi:hypothetical protein